MFSYLKSLFETSRTAPAQLRVPNNPHTGMPATGLNHRLNDTLSRALHYCFATQNERGAWEALPDPRLFDTALVAYALSCVPKHAAVAAVGQARAYLQRALPQRHEPLARLLDETPRQVLERSIQAVDLRHPELFSVVFRRKALLLYALARHARMEVLTPFSPTGVRALVRSAYLERDAVPLKEGSRIDLLAIYLLLEALAGDVPSAGEALRCLRRVQAADGSFCRNLVTTALAFLALNESAPGSPAWRRCYEHLLGAQRRDGTWRFCTTEVWDTTLMVRAFRDHPDFQAKALPRAIRFLVHCQNADGGWGFRVGVESDNETSACALLALHGFLEDGSRIARRGVRHLAAMQRCDGLWSTWQSAEDPPVEDCVAHVVRAVAAWAPRFPLDLPRNWLAQQYQTHGRWTPGWYRNRSYGVHEVSQGLEAGHPATRDATLRLLEGQRADGGFPAEEGGPSSASATGLALAALLCEHDVEAPFVRRGLDFLAETQLDSGTWAGHPETCGPRPLLCHFQTSTHALAVHGLMAAWRRLHRLAILARKHPGA
jgi:squalene-hopene/tetraprenyl-beta-curcumene cyclase